MNYLRFPMENVSVRTLMLPELLNEFLPDPPDFASEPAKIGSLRPFSTNSTSHDDPTRPETRRCQYLRGTIRRPIENATGKNRTFSERIGRKGRYFKNDPIQLGVRHAAAAHWSTAQNSGISGRFGAYSDTPEIKFQEFSKKYPQTWISHIDISTGMDTMSPVTSRTVHGVARQLTETKNTSQNLPPRRDTRPVRAGSLFVNHVEVML